MSLQSISITGGENPECSVCIATYRRPEGLRRLLESLLTQRGAPSFEVVIIDNDASMSAQATADAFSGALEIRYAVEAEPGLAAVRNRSITMARGEFLAFADDDEVVPESWLCTLHRVLVGSEASAAIGPVEAEFESGVDDSIRGCLFFERSEVPEGTPLQWFQAHIGNSCLRASALPDRTAPFRAQFGKTGGEDIDLFKRIAEAGGTFVAAREGACVKEFRDRARANFWWALRRGVRNGGNLADLEWVGVGRRERLRLALSSLRTAARKSIDAIKARGGDEMRFVKLCIEAAEEVGRALSVLGYRYPEYGCGR